MLERREAVAEGKRFVKGLVPEGSRLASSTVFDGCVDSRANTAGS
jgi:hypothetical protein